MVAPARAGHDRASLASRDRYGWPRVPGISGTSRPDGWLAAGDRTDPPWPLTWGRPAACVGKRHCRGGQRISSWYPQVLIADLLRSPGGPEQLFAALDRLIASVQR